MAPLPTAHCPLPTYWMNCSPFSMSAFRFCLSISVCRESTVHQSDSRGGVQRGWLMSLSHPAAGRGSFPPTHPTGEV